MSDPKPIKYMAFADREEAGAWRVEGIDDVTQDCYIAIFLGLDPEYRANEYAAFKNGKHPAIKPAVSAPPTFVQQDDPRTVRKIVVKVQDGQEATLYLEGLEWTWDAKRKTITGRQKSPIALSSK